ncbi:glycosyl hydrolase [Haloferula sargassicola]
MQAGLGLMAGLSPLHAASPDWPVAPIEAKPWRQLSAVSLAEGLLPDLGQLSAEGFGGVVFPAWHEDPDLWMLQTREMAAEAQLNGLGFDLRLNDFPRPDSALDELRVRKVEPFQQAVSGGQEVRIDLPSAEIDTIGAWPLQGSPTDLSSFVQKDGTLVWNAPPGDWRIFGLALHKADKELDPFSDYSMALWLDFHEKPLEEDGVPAARSKVFERSATTTGDWSPEFHETFIKLRGYDLREQLPALLGDGDPGVSQRVTSDYRETLGDLHLKALGAWHERTRAEGSLSRSVLRGNPGHPVDLHAVADIPSVLSPEDPPFAASAAHFALKPLVSGIVAGGKTATPDEIRRQCEALWIKGANQIVLGPINEALEPGIPALTAWITRIQTILQDGAPDPDVLLYFPYHDFLATRGGLPDDPDERLDWIAASGFGHALRVFEKAGIECDIVSDKLLATATAANGRIILGGLSYKAVILPEVRRLPETTAAVLRDLSRRSGRIGILGDWPTDVPGFPSPDIRRGTLIQALENISRPEESDDPLKLAAALGIEGEPLTRFGLRAVRRIHAEGNHYWIVNPTDESIDATFELARPAAAAVMLDPTLPDRAGLVSTATGGNRVALQLSLAPHESRLVRTYRQAPPDLAAWPETMEAIDLRGRWQLTFPGGKTTELPLLGSWRTLADPEMARAGSPVSYRLEFEVPDGSDAWLLDLGKVAHVAEVTIDGGDPAPVFGCPAVIDLGSLPAGAHQLELSVSALPGTDAAGLLGPVRLLPLVKGRN